MASNDCNQSKCFCPCGDCRCGDGCTCTKDNPMPGCTCQLAQVAAAAAAAAAACLCKCESCLSGSHCGGECKEGNNMESSKTRQASKKTNNVCYAVDAYTQGFILATAAMINDCAVVLEARDAAILSTLNTTQQRTGKRNKICDV